MLEILVGVARMPVSYRSRRKDQLKADYEGFLTCPPALDAFHLLIGEKAETEVGVEGLACYRSVSEMAQRDIAAIPAG
jgi:hypothetical protein